jgi:hypothetical protein
MEITFSTVLKTSVFAYKAIKKLIEKLKEIKYPHFLTVYLY